MVLEAVEIRVVSIAVSDLHWHAAEDTVPEVREDRKAVKPRIIRDIDRVVIRTGRYRVERIT